MQNLTCVTFNTGLIPNGIIIKSNYRKELINAMRMFYKSDVDIVILQEVFDTDIFEWLTLVCATMYDMYSDHHQISLPKLYNHGVVHLIHKRRSHQFDEIDLTTCINCSYNYFI